MSLECPNCEAPDYFPDFSDKVCEACLVAGCEECVVAELCADCADEDESVTG